MKNKARLVLEDGSTYEGIGFGSSKDAIGEVVFNTSMTGYQELLTDPSCAGQIVVSTYPLIGNYGIDEDNVESSHVHANGFVVRECCTGPSHYKSTGAIDEYLSSYDVPAISELDTRAIARKLRSQGSMMGIITSSLEPHQAMEKLRLCERYENQNFISNTSTSQPINYPVNQDIESALRILVLDYGLPNSLLKRLGSLGANIQVVPPALNSRQILSLNPDGLILSPGPGNPDTAGNIIDVIRNLTEKVPMMGIGFGNLLISRAFGAKTYKMKFGHRGANQPVLELENGRAYITAQNHGFAVDPDTLRDGLEVSFINVNDGSVEGLKHKSLPIFSIQFLSEASPGPFDSTHIFKRFIKMIEEQKNNLSRC
jgi:carbamoyl-phosphate synthase small subunit